MQHGEIGTINKDGKQVGGFRDWTLDVIVEEITTGIHRDYISQKVKAHAKRFWLLEPIGTDKYMCIFYQHLGDDIIPLFQNELKVNIPNGIEIDKYVDTQLEMEG